MTIKRMNVRTGEIETVNEDAPSFPQPAQVPQAVSAFQFKAHLDALGKLADAEALVTGSPKIVQLAWDSATEFRRNSPTVNQMAAQLGFTTKEAKDAFFIDAAKIEL